MMRNLIVSRMFAVLSGIGATLGSAILADEPAGNQPHITQPRPAAVSADELQPESAGRDAAKAVQIEIHELHQEVSALRQNVKRLIEVLQTSHTQTSAREKLPRDSGNEFGVGTTEQREVWRLTLHEAIQIALQNAAEIRDLAFYQSSGSRLVISERASGKSTLELAIAARNVVSDTEEAYWKLWKAHRDWQSAIEMRDLAQMFWKIAFERHINGIASSSEKTGAEQHYFSCCSALDQSIIEFQQSELQLRRVLGLSESDGRFLHPVDEPPTAIGKLDANEAQATAFATRFELVQQRRVIERRKRERDAARTKWTTADSGLPTSVLDAMYGMPVGHRLAISRRRNLELNLARDQARLKELEFETSRLLVAAIQAVDSTAAASQRQLDRMSQAKAELDTASLTYRHGKGNWGVLLKAQHEWAQSARDYHAAMVEHAIARKNVDLHRGALLTNRDVTLTGDALKLDE